MANNFRYVRTYIILIVILCRSHCIGATSSGDLRGGGPRHQLVAGGHHVPRVIFAQPIDRNPIIVVSNMNTLVRIISSCGRASICAVDISMVVVGAIRVTVSKAGV